MLSILRKLFFDDKRIDEYLKRDAIILDVRTTAEFESGHGENAMNIPLSQLESKLNELREMNRPVITVCASGARSGSAAELLRKNGIEAVNGGGWKDLA